MRNVTALDPSKVRAIATKLGLAIKEKSGEFKVYDPTVGVKRSIAVPNTKLATRIYLVGFEAKDGTVAHPKPPAATVTQMFDHSLPEKLLLSAIYKACKSLVAKAAPAPKAEEAKVEEAASPAPEAAVA
jgi:hypothetical protein